MDTLPFEITFEIVKHLTLEDLCNFRVINSFCERFCDDNKTGIQRNIVKRYIPDWQDETNFIYTAGGGMYGDFNSIFKAYLAFYKRAEIRFPRNVKITSFPIFPYMTHFSGCDNQLESFPVQPQMRHFEAPNNKLKSFPVQPKMIYFYAPDNQLKSFPVQLQMKRFVGTDNQLASFPVQPQMTHFYGRNNQLVSFPVQPQMIFTDHIPSAATDDSFLRVQQSIGKVSSSAKDYGVLRR